MKGRSLGLVFLPTLIFVGFLLGQPASAQVRFPYNIFGNILNADSSVPAPADIRFTAYISSRPAEVLTEVSQGSSVIDVGGSTQYLLDLASLTTQYQNGDQVVIVVVNALLSQAKTNFVTVDTAVPFKQSDVQLVQRPVVISPGITSQPDDVLTGVGGTATFTVGVSGTAPFTFQWKKGSTTLSGKTSQTLVLNNVQGSDAGAYSVSITNAAGFTNSDPATLTVLVPPSILTPPRSQVVTQGVSSVSFNVVAGGTPPFSYQWCFNGNPLDEGAKYVGVTTTNLTVFNLQDSDEGNYSVAVSNALGAAESASAALQVIGFGSLEAQINGQPVLDHDFTNVTSVTVSLLSSVSNATLFFTLDGSPPDYASILYLGPFAVTQSVVLRAIAYDTEFNTAELEPTPIRFHLTAPVITVNGLVGASFDFTNASSVEVQMQAPLPGMTVYYSLDDSIPTLASATYQNPFDVVQSVVIRAMVHSLNWGSATSEPVNIQLWQTHTLTASTVGGGVVALHPPDGVYRNDATVQLTATPHPGWTFLWWKGDEKGRNPVVSVAADRDKVIEAVFGTTLGSRVVGSGAVRLNPASALYPYGSKVLATGVPEPGQFFALRGGVASGNTNPFPLFVTTSNQIIAALFAALPTNRVALTVISSGCGSVSVSPRANLFTQGQAVSLTAVPDGTNQFLSWSGDVLETQDPLALTMDASKVIVANFTGNVTAPTLSAVRLGESNVFSLVMTGEPNLSWAIETSTNLADWVPLTTLTNASGALLWSDSGAVDFRHRFYRVVAE